MDIVTFIEKEHAKVWQRAVKKYSNEDFLGSIDNTEGFNRFVNEAKVYHHKGFPDQLIAQNIFGYWYFVGQQLNNFKEAAVLLDFMATAGREDPLPINFYTSLEGFKAWRRVEGRKTPSCHILEHEYASNIDQFDYSDFPIIILDLPDSILVNKGTPEYDEIINFQGASC